MRPHHIFGSKGIMKCSGPMGGLRGARKPLYVFLCTCAVCGGEHQDKSVAFPHFSKGVTVLSPHSRARLEKGLTTTLSPRASSSAQT